MTAEAQTPAASAASPTSTGVAAPAWAVLCALSRELGTLRERIVRRRTLAGVELLELELDGARALAAVGGVGKVRAAQATTALFAAGATRGLLVVGVCGGLRGGLAPGNLVHCTRAYQTDLALRDDREVDADPTLRAAWRACAPGREGSFLTADRPVLSTWRKLRLLRAYLGTSVADMETAAAAAVAARAGVPWAALRAVTDGAGTGGAAAFRIHFPAQAGRAADTVPELLNRLAGSPPGPTPGSQPCGGTTPIGDAT